MLPFVCDHCDHEVVVGSGEIPDHAKHGLCRACYYLEMFPPRVALICACLAAVISVQLSWFLYLLISYVF